VPPQAGGPSGPAGAGTDPQDDAPTIISRNGPQPARREESFTGSLRGRRLAHFELIEPIGVGGMAAVIRARDLQLDRTVALKILPPEMAGDPENVRRFHQEARAAARLDHENIARVFFCGEDQRLHFIAFEFVEGENLRVLLERRGRLPVAEAVHYMLQIATGLAHASARGVVHRDIKPSNIIIGTSGRAKLVDMGLARSLEPHGEGALTQSGVTLGTFDYISPEQALEPRDADVRSDLYSLGCTFYHMLTGQPPVPEGTAAKKLHHHQHVAPVDPRQLNPEVPDDVAAVLGRMMAKDPKDRYQRAEHLVQHLLQVAQKWGAVSEAPDAVLFVDAPLPAPPRRRPALLAGLAVVALGGLLAILSLAPTDAGPGPARRHAFEPPTDPAAPKDAGPAKDRREKNVRPAAADVPRQRVRVHSVRELAAAVRRPSVQYAVLANDLDLTPVGGEQADGRAGPLVIRRDPADPLVIESDRKGPPRTLRVPYPPEADELPGAGLTVAAGDVTFRHVRFEVVGLPPPESRRLGLALTLRGGRVVLERCTFAQTGFSPPLGAEKALPPPIQAALVAVTPEERGPAARPGLTLTRCFFEKGLSAITLTGPADVRATDCAFGPHAVLFHLRGNTGPQDTLVRLDRCSALVVDGPVFRLDRRAGAAFRVERSLFSLPAGSPADNPWRDLVLQTDSKDFTKVLYRGASNCYHNLNFFWVGYEDDQQPKMIPAESLWADFRQELERQGGKEDGSTVLPAAASPWAAKDPLAQVESTHSAQAFALNVHMPQLRLAKEDALVGVREGPRGPLYPSPLPALPRKGPAALVRQGPHVKIVDPQAKPGAGGSRVYLKLESAIVEAEPGDEIQIRSNAALSVGQVRLNKATVDLTIKAYAGCHPVLVLDETKEGRAALFHLHDGQIRFEGLEFRLNPNDAEFNSLAAVEMIGNGRCVFRRCVVTLVEPRRDADRNSQRPTSRPVRPAVVRLADPGEAMKMGVSSTRRAPEVRLRDCLVRGQGDLAVVRPSRPFDLDVAGTLVALDGSLLTVAGTLKDPPPAEQNQVVRLTNVTAYLTGHFLHLRSRGGKGLVPTVVERAERNLFVAAGAKPRAFIQCEGLDSGEQMNRLVSWKGGSHNAYLNYEKMLDSPRTPPYDPETWKKSDNVFDAEPYFSRGKFDGDTERPLSQAVPGDFKVLRTPDAKMDPQKYGADLDRLPEVAAPARPEEDVPEEG
jgi:hypothetical protein